ncbi:MAG TPA: LysR substrate-binding domain-containing protein, partial [Noviherbaspirillum sp.]|nr:LysR substrate-binding domain-containing protein [Noviherbaspirillum sp.]
LYDSLNVREEKLAIVASANHPEAHARRLAISDLAQSPWVVYSANMPMRLLLEREFHEAGLQFPLNLIETTSAFTTLALLQRNPSMVAVFSIDVARFCTGFGMTTILPVELRSRSDPYFLVTRRDRSLSPVAQLLVQEFLSEPAIAWRDADQVLTGLPLPDERFKDEVFP